jgi:hypothetical protein
VPALATINNLNKKQMEELVFSTHKKANGWKQLLLRNYSNDKLRRLKGAKSVALEFFIFNTNLYGKYGIML